MPEIIVMHIRARQFTTEIIEDVVPKLALRTALELTTLPKLVAEAEESTVLFVELEEEYVQYFSALCNDLMITPVILVTPALEGSRMNAEFKDSDTITIADLETIVLALRPDLAPKRLFERTESKVLDRIETEPDVDDDYIPPGEDDESGQ